MTPDPGGRRRRSQRVRRRPPPQRGRARADATAEASLLKKLGRGASRIARVAVKGPAAFAKEVKKFSKSPAVRAALRAGSKIVPAKELYEVGRAAAKFGAKSLPDALRFASAVVSFVPGVGTGVAAALGAAEALASGKRITAVVMAAARSAIPGGAVAHAAFDFAAGLAEGKKLTQAALETARARLPGGRAAQAAFDAGLALARGKKIQDAAVAAAGRALPPLRYTNDAVAFARAVGSGKSVQNAALTAAGRQMLKKVTREVDLKRIPHKKAPWP
jgi:hypothetical protein